MLPILDILDTRGKNHFRRHFSPPASYMLRQQLFMLPAERKVWGN